jgi:putative membrane protein
VSNLNIQILVPVAIGAVIGLVAFSHFLSWIYKKFKDHTIATLSGFILGSLAILWPWKNEVYRLDANGHILMKDGEQVIQGYERYIPQTFSSEVTWSIIIMMTGILSIWLIEKLAVIKEN